MTRYPFKSLWKRALVACFDGIGRVLSLPFRVFRKHLDLASVCRILVIRLDHIGDVVMSRPAIRALHKKFPHASIDLLVTEDIAPLFKHSTEIQSVIPVKDGWFNRKASFIQKWTEFWNLRGFLSAKTYDLGIDLRGDLRNILLMRLAGVRHTIGYGNAGGGFLLSEEASRVEGQHQVELNLNLLKTFHIAQDDKLLPFEYSQETARHFREKTAILQPAKLLPRIVIHMGSGYPSKRWPFDNFKALIKRIDREAIAQIVLIGTSAEKSLMSDLNASSEKLIDLRGITDLSDLPVLLDVCDIFIGNDSGPAHIAAAQGLEILLLASGTTDILLWHPWTERLTLLKRDVPCAPCDQEFCPIEGHPCVANISVEQAYDALLYILSRLQKRTTT